ncbi:alkaline phosphatase D family protein [Photobacterium leiognathi]|uniref:alkaline phosphatase D family protein n=1 Tax=Photobacterium leiognathi TaxID=553611 RepID=UPI002981A978|nr:alkaline phosphatase D family protein [Photobacterium leiognathi]
MSLSRRGFVKALSSAAMVTSLTGCNSNDEQQEKSKIEVGFNHGVASGDPLQHSVIIWTRITTEARLINVQWQVATDEQFTQIVASGEASTDSTKDFTVKVDVNGLQPNQHYYYRFEANDTASPVGQTQTLAEGELDKASIAVVSCSNFPAGYFNVYREIVKQHQTSPINAVLHLGDYIYEYGAGQYATEDAQRLNRIPSKESECVTLDDYRKRYAQYRSDNDLQALHAALPMIAIWDDHEIANDTWREGAENHQQQEGDFSQRRAAAALAWLEWLPVRENPVSSMITYRDFSFGDLFDLYMLDTRVVARDEPLDYFSLTDTSIESISGLIQQARAPERKLLGTDQKQWLSERMTTNTAKWSLLGQQVLMGKIEMPSSVMMGLFQLFQASDANKPAAMNAVQNAITAYLTDPSSDLYLLPYNLDAWDGFYMEREWLYGVTTKLNKQLITLAGDSHNAWCSELSDHKGKGVGVEFATSSVTSPGLEKYLGLDLQTIGQMEFVIPQLVSDLQWVNLKQRGFVRLDIDHQQVLSTWHFVSTVKDKEYQVESQQLVTKNGLTVS